MSANRSRRIDRRTAEQLLRGEPDRMRETERDALSELLSAAAAPATEGELAGEQAALAAFRAAHPVPVLQPRRTSMIKTTLAKLLTVKVAAVAAGAVAAGGVALAATTGTLAPHSGGSTPAPAATSHAPDVAPTPQNDQSVAGQDKQTGAGGSDATPSPSLIGLCQAYTAGAGSDHGKALDNPAFSVLITTAGGRDKVAQYCTGLLSDHGKPETTHPAAPSAADKRPTETHPTGAPATHPSGPPETRPSH
ncbi:hypothetical protein [Amycolatopsis alkalitolerans]|uniref:Uncharacterized protein n=1 Tax=Amycolatopsis alkalitolerans TaxID=2547244 RepID=A0A5C4M390_9PSEU|nr:hypothetical protein [Amycolatopsis alkalitolerans]TNC26894.1 hypothetical protein FG385_10680 [Amycolatopsis alkalitolerans]